jgi:hypothetical protein
VRVCHLQKPLLWGERGENGETDGERIVSGAQFKPVDFVLELGRICGLRIAEQLPGSRRAAFGRNPLRGFASRTSFLSRETQHFYSPPDTVRASPTRRIFPNAQGRPVPSCC